MSREDHRLTVLPFDKVQIADIPTRTHEIITNLERQTVRAAVSLNR
jgi:hypothetical protein